MGDRVLYPGTSHHVAFDYSLEQAMQSEGHFSAQEVIQQLIRKNPKDVVEICACPVNQDKSVWIIEQLRQFVLELNAMCVELDAVCTSESCPTMIATKDEFLCAAHSAPQQCCAIDYIIHTLNGFTALLNNMEYFPSRVKVNAKSVQFVASITRRLYRIFAHAYFKHVDMFWKFEMKTFLCSRFKHFVVSSKLMSSDQFIIPPLELQNGINGRSM